MKCEICDGCKPGVIYMGEGYTSCLYCGEEVETNAEQLYIGFNERTGTHDFRLLKSKNCPGCGARVFLVANPCSHEEFEKGIEEFFGINNQQESENDGRAVDRFAGHYEEHLGDGYE